MTIDLTHTDIQSHYMRKQALTTWNCASIGITYIMKRVSCCIYTTTKKTGDPCRENTAAGVNMNPTSTSSEIGSTSRITEA